MKKSLYFLVAVATSFIFANCDPAAVVTPDPLAWIEKLDTSVSAAQKNQIRAWISEA